MNYQKKWRSKINETLSCFIANFCKFDAHLFVGLFCIEMIDKLIDEFEILLEAHE